MNIYDLPTIEDPRLEKTYCEVLNLYRSGEELDSVVLDWMDSANNWLSEKK